MFLFRLKRYTKCTIYSYTHKNIPGTCRYYNLLLINSKKSNLDNITNKKISLCVAKKHIDITKIMFPNAMSHVSSQDFAFRFRWNDYIFKNAFYEKDRDFYNFVYPMGDKKGIVIIKVHNKLLIIFRPYKIHYMCANAYIYLLIDSDIYQTEDILDNARHLLSNTCHKYKVYLIKNKKAMLVNWFSREISSDY